MIVRIRHFHVDPTKLGIQEFRLSKRGLLCSTHRLNTIMALG
jgi:hypothetical protein